MSTYESTILVNQISSLVSATACIFMIANYFILKELKTYSYKLIAIQVGFDLGRCLSNLLPTYELSTSNPMCQIQGLCIQFFTCGSMAWAGVISTTLYMSVVKMLPGVENFHFKFLGVTLIFCLISSLPPLITANYVRIASWCWIDPEGLGYIWIIVNTHAMYFLIQIYNLVLYIAVVRSVRETTDASLSQEKKKRIVKRVIWYPIMLAVCYVPMGVYRIYEALGGAKSFEMVNIGVLFLNLNGLFNCLKYSTTDTVKAAIGKRICRNKVKVQDLGKTDRGIDIQFNISYSDDI